MKKYDQCLLDNGYTILELVDKASQCLLKHMNGEYFSLLCGPGNNGADGLSLAIKLNNLGKKVDVYILRIKITYPKPIDIIWICVMNMVFMLFCLMMIF